MHEIEGFPWKQSISISGCIGLHIFSMVLAEQEELRMVRILAARHTTVLTARSDDYKR